MNLHGRVPLDATIGQCADQGRNFVTEYADSVAANIYRSVAEGL